MSLLTKGMDRAPATQRVSTALLVVLLVLLAGCAGSPTRESTGQYVDDAAITAKVKVALLKAPDVSSTAVDVETFKGVVQLSGFVDSEQQRTRAGAIAAEVPGVRRVLNDLAVKTAATG